MNNQIRKKTDIWYKFLGIVSFCSIVFSHVAASAQITPDNTLPNNSEVKVEGNKSIIEGGTKSSGNVTTGSEAHFKNAVDISNNPRR